MIRRAVLKTLCDFSIPLSLSAVIEAVDRQGRCVSEIQVAMELARLMEKGLVSMDNQWRFKLIEEK